MPRTCAQNLALRCWASARHRQRADAVRLAELEHYPGLRPGYKILARRAIQSCDTVRQARALKQMLHEINRVELSREQVRKAYGDSPFYRLLVA